MISGFVCNGLMSDALNVFEKIGIECFTSASNAFITMYANRETWPPP